MKTIKHDARKLVVGCLFACCLFLLSFQAFAIEGLTISVPSTNALLTWPTDSSLGETYIIQYRHTLNDSNDWTTLADYYPPDYTTNFTSFIDPSAVDNGFGYGSGGTNGGGGNPMPGGTNTSGGFSTNIPVAGTGFYRVVRDGVHLIGYSNGMVLSGIVKIPVELGNGSGTVSTMSMTENETPIGNSLQTAPLSNPHFLTLNTTFLANGAHDIYGTASWTDTNGGLWEANSPTISVTISNEISFENWMPSFGELGDSLLIRATSAHPDTDWYIDVYGANGGYIGTFGGHTYDGDIAVAWNLIGPLGESHTNDAYFNFYIGTEYIDPPMPPTFRVKDPWPAKGAWAMAMQHDWDTYHDSDKLYDMFQSFAGWAKDVRHDGVVPSPSSDNNPFTLRVGDPSETGPDLDWSTFRAAITNPLTRNLVYFGHGGPTGIGKNTANPKRFISDTEIAAALHTVPAAQTNRHAFRFVFLDGCSTAAGKLPEAFGIQHRENIPYDDYYYASARPQAFVGWPKDQGIGFLQNNGYINVSHVNFMLHIQFEMTFYGRGVKTAIRNASHYFDTFGVYGEENLKVYGYWGLLFGQANQ